MIENKHVTRNNSKKNKDEQDEHDFLSKFPFYGSVNILPRNVPMHQAFFFFEIDIYCSNNVHGQNTS